MQIATFLLFAIGLLLGTLILDITVVEQSAPSPPAPRTASTSRPPEASPEAPLQLLNHRCFREHGFSQIVRQVRNTTKMPLNTVVAAGSFLASNGTLVKVEEAIVQYDPIMPDEISPFRVMGTDDPLITSCDVSFKKMLSGQLTARR